MSRIHKSTDTKSRTAVVRGSKEWAREWDCLMSTGLVLGVIKMSWS
jgi:hypothetical protein